MGLEGKRLPLVCGLALRRLTVSALCMFDKGFVNASVDKSQVAVRNSAGFEKVGFRFRALVEEMTEIAMLQIDAVSAFNNIDRQRVLDLVFAPALHLLAHASMLMTRESKAVLRKIDGSHSILRITTVVDQGDSLSPFH